MKKIIAIFISLLTLIAGWSASTHANQPLPPTPQMMMQNLEYKALGADLQQEMQNLMTKMMSGNGNLNDEETNKMIGYMNQYPGPYNMMMGRMMAQNLGWGERRDNAWGMMNWANWSGWGGWFGLFGFVLPLVWLGIGLLILIWLFKKVFGDKK
ncbi:MAG: hypothetical protein HYV54_02690, partial [Parcubacteria group bacterium]|nr:hypothetical protein [Parcubacteria group bacterium]